MADPIEFRVGDYAYKSRHMDVFTQLDILAKLTPLLAAGFVEVVGIFLLLRERGVAIEDAPLTEAAKLVRPVAAELSRMSQEDRRYIIASCLSVCERQSSGQQAWAPIWNTAAGMAMHQDINSDVSVVLRIALGVIDGTFRRFFPESVWPFLDKVTSFAFSR